MVSLSQSNKGGEAKLVITDVPQDKSKPIYIRMLSPPIATQVKQVYNGRTMDVVVQNLIRQASKGVIIFEINGKKK